MSMSRSGLAGAALVVGALAASALAQPDIGGTPLHTEEDFFTGNDLWGMNVWSYVYDATTDLPAGFVLEADEMLFAYLLDAEDTKPVSIDAFSIGNPNVLPILSVGFASTITPPGYDGGLREDPYVYGYSGSAQATIFTYTGDFSDPFSTLDPEEWSLVWYIAQSPTWSLGSATASGAGISDNQFVPVPDIPAPGAAALLAIAAACSGAHRRRR